MSMLAILLLGCVTAESFPDRAASVACARSEECFRSDFESLYASRGECVDEQVEVFEPILDCYRERCTFQADVAQDYLSSLRSAECDDVGSAFGELDGVYTECEDELGLFGCLASLVF